MPIILCLGNSTWDRIYSVEEIPSQATKYFSNQLLEVGGGVAATAAVAAARLGARVFFAGRQGNDTVGDQITLDFAKYNVDTRFLRKFDSVLSPSAVVHVDKRGERQITVLKDLNMPTDAAWIDETMLDGVDCVLCDCTWPEGAERILSLARELNIETVIDADIGGEGLRKLLPLGTHVAFSHPALRDFSKTDNTEEALKIAQQFVKGTVYVTQGEKGCFWLEGGKLQHLPAYQVDVVDTTGAGDVFHGALALAISEKAQCVEAVRFASATAALKCTQVGGRAGIPQKAQVLEFINNNIQE
ncbi:PfkB family carbohydrate kinase [Pseudovibrio sp. Tun.PSC04-5.I4]|uniref:PfkB family carbohydrate kinase n=1 Tax=Pseudovibrio sp. Tun.PSC04-5.I4 TaxID=1798213 RepID=UPI000886A46E|nr:PfkB family carbohydrate kinase [Pseudovibrio sp. Tun.PSC04-5.I4]SDR48869.1 sulfofructose kinase [Pseudovibrio sp. Tun.PSC04-5.I4]